MTEPNRDENEVQGGAALPVDSVGGVQPEGDDVRPFDQTGVAAAPVSAAAPADASRTEFHDVTTHDHAVEAAGDQPAVDPEADDVPEAEPTQTDNSERPEDGEQDVSQDPDEVDPADEQDDVPDEEV